VNNAFEAYRSLRSTALGFTLIELLTSLLILSLLTLMSYRGLGAVLDARDHVSLETGKWRNVELFIARFESDLRLASPRQVRTGTGTSALLPAWQGQPTETERPSIEFSRFAATEGMDNPRRVGYRLNGKHEIELWIWPGLDVPQGTKPRRYPVLAGVEKFESQYLGPDLTWVSEWPLAGLNSPIPRAVRLRLVLSSGEQIVRVFALGL